MEVYRYDSVPMWWADSPRTANPSTPKSAVEKAGAWKPAKTKPRFPPVPTLPWKSRKPREIPTFPPRRRRFVFSNPRRRRLTPPKPKPDRSRVNQTGHLDLLTTGCVGWSRPGVKRQPQPVPSSQHVHRPPVLALPAPATPVVYAPRYDQR